jgi:hypothetical protein
MGGLSYGEMVAPHNNIIRTLKNESPLIKARGEYYKWH